MQADLFDPDIPEDGQDAYRQALEAQYASDLKAIRERGEIPPWIESDHLLQKDEMRMLKVVADNCGYILDGRVGDSDKSVAKFTHDTGFLSDLNCRATLNRCLELNYLSMSIDRRTGNKRLDLADEGQWRLDVVETEEWWDSRED